mmetsp:Transcript_19463/g.41625  ORF Transcript_19463/g.41625 Transcript_19463/m.41625 type:complete len:228 (-) Transcript_19463:38-721(-)
MMDVFHTFGSELTRRRLGIVKSFVPAHDPVNLPLNPIQVEQRPRDLAHDVVQPRTKAAARHDRRVDVRGVEVQLRPRAGADVRARRGRIARLPADVGEDALAIADELVVPGSGFAVHVAHSRLAQRRHDVLDSFPLRGEVLVEAFDVPQVDSFDVDAIQLGARWQALLLPLRIFLEATFLIELILLSTFRHSLALELALDDEVGGRGAGCRRHQGDCFSVDVSGHDA